MNKVAILFYFSVLPDGSAGAARIVVLAKLLKSIGYHPVMLGVAYTENKPVRATYEGIEYELLSFPELTLNGIHAIQRTSAIQKHLQQWLDAYRDQNGIDLILFTEYQGFAHFFQTYAQKNKIKLIQNVVEWYPREGFPGILGSLRYLKHTYDMRWGYKFTGNIIGISSFLCKHFAQQGCRTIRIPTIVDIDTYDIADAANENKVVLAYAGVPWGKDCVMNVIRAITQLNQDEKRESSLIYTV